MPSDKLGQGRVTLDVDFVGLREVSEKLDQLIAATKKPAPMTYQSITTGVESPAEKRTVLKRDPQTGAYGYDRVDPFDPETRKWIWARHWTAVKDNKVGGLTLYRYNGGRDGWEIMALVTLGGKSVDNVEWVPVPAPVVWNSTTNSVFTRVGPNV
jgi:hypothetical protein